MHVASAASARQLPAVPERAPERAYKHPQEAFDPEAGLFLATADGELFPNPAAQATLLSGLPGPVAPQQAFEFLGRMLGKAMYEGILVEVPLARFLLKQVRGHRCDLNDLPSRDRVLHANLLKLTQVSPNELADSTLYFTINDATGREVKLMPGAPLPMPRCCHPHWPPSAPPRARVAQVATLRA